MSKSKFRTAMFLLFASVFAALALRFNALGHAAFAIEQATLDVIDEQLPTSPQMDELARVNRLVTRKALPAVVQITSEAEIESDEIPAWHSQVRIGQGSGVIIDADQGYILTNNHVVGDPTTIRIRTHDGRRFEAQLVGRDAPTDLAVVQIEAEQLFELVLGDSDALQVGDPVMTVGNPFGLAGTVSKGIVSAKERSTPARILDYEGFIQTDAVINPGNSGGPLVNMRAEIVGLNTAIETRTGSFNGVGFAIPAARIRKLLPTLLKGEKIVRGYLGVEMISVTESYKQAQALGWAELHGVLIRNVIPESPANQAGLRSGDILIGMDGSQLPGSGDLTEKIAFTQPGNQVVFDVWRDRELTSIETTIGRQPENFSTRGRVPEPFADARGDDGRAHRPVEVSELGVTVEILTRRKLGRLQLGDDVSHGVVVSAVAKDSLAEASEIHVGDVLIAINETDVYTTEDVDRLWDKADLDEGVALSLVNKHGTRSVMISTQ